MKILAIDQSRYGGWSLFDYKKKQLIDYGAFNFPSPKYTYPQAIFQVKRYVLKLLKDTGASAIFIEDIQLRRNVDSFKKLAQLQGVLVDSFIENEYLYDVIAPSTWQAYCNARGRTTKEIKNKTESVDVSNKKKSKILSLTFVKDNFDVITDNDNMADAICIGWYAVNNIKIK